MAPTSAPISCERESLLPAAEPELACPVAVAPLTVRIAFDEVNEELPCPTVAVVGKVVLAQSRDSLVSLIGIIAESWSKGADLGVNRGRSEDCHSTR